jgi:hypothetical protein
MLARMLKSPFFALACVAAVGFGTACSPAFNWREVRPDDTALSVLLPCKPDKAQQTVPMGGQPTALTLLGCDAGGAAFAVAVADLGQAATVPAVLAQWQAVTLAGIQAANLSTTTTTTTTAMAVPGALAAPAPVLVRALGRRPDGSAVHSHALYFAHGTQVFQVVMLASTVTPEAADMFFSSVRLK